MWSAHRQFRRSTKKRSCKVSLQSLWCLEIRCDEHEVDPVTNHQPWMILFPDHHLEKFYSTYQMLTCWVIVMLDDPSIPRLQCYSAWPRPLAPRCGEVVLYPWQKSSSKAYFHPCAWLWGLCSLGHTWHFLSSKRIRLSRWQRARFWFHLTVALSTKPPLNHLDKLPNTSGALCPWCPLTALWSVIGGEVGMEEIHYVDTERAEIKSVCHWLTVTSRWEQEFWPGDQILALCFVVMFCLSLNYH